MFNTQNKCNSKTRLCEVVNGKGASCDILSGKYWMIKIKMENGNLNCEM